MVDPRASSDLAPALPAPPDALVAETWVLDPPGPGEHSALMRPEAAAVVDGLLARVARGHGALDVAIGEQLEALSDDDANLGGLCAVHHLHGVHGGWIEVRGEAPERLVWRMAAPPVA